MAKKAKVDNADEILRMMYPDLRTSDDDEPKDKPENADADRIAAFEAKIAALEGRLASGGSDREAPAPQRGLPTPPMKPQIDYSKAPDPIQDPQGYAAFVHNATQATITYEKEAYQWQQRVAQSQAGRVEALWTSFRENHADKAKDETRVEVAAQRVVARAQAAGIDTDKYMFEQSGKFLKDVASEIDKLWPSSDNGQGDDDDDDDMTDLPGGQAGGRTQNSGAQPKKESRYGELGSEVLAWQQKTGFVH